jgi:hypothetical protein
VAVDFGKRPQFFPMWESPWVLNYHVKPKCEQDIIPTILFEGGALTKELLKFL